jgi:hypothetical protein
MSKGIDVYIDSGVHVEGFTELTDEAKEIAKQKFIDAIQNNQLVFYWDTWGDLEEENND